MRVSFRFFPPSFFFFIWFQWVLSFFFWDLIENLENQVNSLGDSRQCSVLYVRLNCLEPHTSTHTRSPDKIDLSWRYILVYGFRWSWDGFGSPFWFTSIITPCFRRGTLSNSYSFNCHLSCVSGQHDRKVCAHGLPYVWPSSAIPGDLSQGDIYARFMDCFHRKLFRIGHGTVDGGMRTADREQMLIALISQVRRKHAAKCPIAETRPRFRHIDALVHWKQNFYLYLCLF